MNTDPEIASLYHVIDWNIARKKEAQKQRRRADVRRYQNNIDGLRSKIAALNAGNRNARRQQA